MLHSAVWVRTGSLKTGHDDTSETVGGHHTAIHTNIYGTQLQPHIHEEMRGAAG